MSSAQIQSRIGGGLVGEGKNTQIYDSYASGSILGNTLAGGLIGMGQSVTATRSAAYLTSIQSSGASGYSGGLIAQCTTNCTFDTLIAGTLTVSGSVARPFAAGGSITGTHLLFWASGGNPNFGNNATPIYSSAFVNDPDVALSASDLLDLQNINPNFDFTATWGYWLTGTGATHFPIPLLAPVIP
jgi:hypothetical protein